MEKRKLIIYSIIALSIAFIVPLFICPKCDCIQAKLGVSFTAMGAVAGVITLYIAISLYQKFGLESQFMERQVDQVLELVDMLKGKVINVKGENYTYLMRFNSLDNELKKEDFYLSLRNKVMLFDPNDYYEFTKPLFEIKKSYWLPNEIKEKLNTILIPGFGKLNIDTHDTSIFVKTDFGNNPKDINYISCNEMTLATFVKAKEDLIETIYNWLKKNCGIILDLKMEEPKPWCN